MKEYTLITIDTVEGKSVKTLNLIEKIETMKAELTPGYDPETGKLRRENSGT